MGISNRLAVFRTAKSVETSVESEPSLMIVDAKAINSISFVDRTEWSPVEVATDSTRLTSSTLGVRSCIFSRRNSVSARKRLIRFRTSSIIPGVVMKVESIFVSVHVEIRTPASRT